MNFLEKNPILLQEIDELDNLVLAARQFPCIGRAGFNARTAAGAGVANPRLTGWSCAANIDGACLNAAAATEAAVGVDHQNRSGIDALGVVAPGA